MMRCLRAVLAAAFLPSTVPVARSSIRRAVAGSVSVETGAVLRATQARTSAASSGGSERCLVLNPPPHQCAADARIIWPSACFGQHRRCGRGQRPGDVLAVLRRGLLPLHVHVGARELVPGGLGLLTLPGRRPAGGEAERLSPPSRSQEGATETVGLRGVAEAFLPQPGAHLPAHLVRG